MWYNLNIYENTWLNLSLKSTELSDIVKKQNISGHFYIFQLLLKLGVCCYKYAQFLPSYLTYLAFSRKCGFSWFMKFKVPQTISLLGEDHLVPLVKHVSTEDKNQWKIKTDEHHLYVKNFPLRLLQNKPSCMLDFLLFLLYCFSKAVNFQRNCVWYSSHCSNLKDLLKKEKKAN